MRPINKKSKSNVKNSIDDEIESGALNVNYLITYRKPRIQIV